MNYQPIYQIIPIINNDLFIEKLDLSTLDKNFTNLFSIGLETMCKIESIREFPIKNRRIAIKQILIFLKYLDNSLSLIKGDTIQIHSLKLINIFNRDSYVDFMKLLNDLNIVKAVKYKDGTYYNKGFNLKDNKKVINKEDILSKRYKLTDSYKNEDLCIVIIDDKKEMTFEKDGVYNKKFTKTINETTVDIKSAIKDELLYMNSYTSLRSRLNTLFTLYDKRYIKKGEKVNRIFHSLTNISKVSRKYLSIKGLKFNNIDIVNCQPLLLCYYLKKNNLKIDETYINDCENGILYERFIIEGKEYIDTEYIIKNGEVIAIKKNTIKIGYNLTEKEIDDVRKKIKVLLYKSIYFDFKPKNDISKMFEELYPEVYKTLENLEKDELKMAGRLQNIEAEIFNNIIPSKSKYYFTLFDAIYFTSQEDTGFIINNIASKFNLIGLNVKLKYNELTFVN